MTIHAYDPTRRTNAQLMVDCHTLGYITEPVLDLTYGKGAFWRNLPNLDITANDINPNKGETHHDFRNHPAPTNSYPTVIFDPPYRAGGTPTTPNFDNAYGLEHVMTPSYVRDLIETGTREAVRIANRHVLIKLQDHVSSGRLQPLTVWATNTAEQAGARLVDSLHVVGGRPQPAGTRQVRARHGYSTLLVFEAPHTNTESAQR